MNCIHCGKPLHYESPIDTVLVDDTGGDVCGSWGTYGNEPHEVERPPRAGNQRST